MVRGLRSGDRGDPSYEGICAEHEAYLEALRSAGVEVTVLPPLEDFPDSLFVEDPALVSSTGAILLRPGAASRAGEAVAIAPALDELFELVLTLPAGSADGGDVLMTPRGAIVGLSGRTDRAGGEALAACLAELGVEARVVETPSGVLHLKTACSMLDEETVLCAPSLAGSQMFGGYRRILTPDGEDAAANALRVNDRVMVGAAFPRTIEQLESLGYCVVPVETSEVGKLDAGLSCLSLRWWDAGKAAASG